MKHLYRLSVMPAIALLMFFALNLSVSAQEASDKKADPSPVTTVNPEVPLDELGFMLKPLSLEDLSTEADVHIYTEAPIVAPVVAALPSSAQNPGELHDDAAIKSQPVEEIDVPEHES